MCNAGTDMINVVKQAQEFGLGTRNIRMAAMIGFLSPDVHTLGLSSASGLLPDREHATGTSTSAPAR